MAVKTGQTNHIVRLSRNVADLAQSTAFYCERLGFSRLDAVSLMDRELAVLLGFESRPVRIQRLRLGLQELELVEAGRTARAYLKSPRSSDLDFQHFAVRCSDIDDAFRRLNSTDHSSPIPLAISHDVHCHPSPIRLPERSGGVVAFKFRDPDGHPIELLQPRGDDTSGKHVSPGIDHTAISVSDAVASIAFYSNCLQFAVTARQINVGFEQGLLDQLDDPMLDVISLQTNIHESPHVELLNYLRPEGASSESSPQGSDLSCDRIVMQVDNLDTISSSIGINASVICNKSGQRCVLLQDPDKHFVLAIERLPS